LAHDHNPQPAKESEVYNVDGDIEFVEFPTCMVGSVVDVKSAPHAKHTANRTKLA
jgi:hypothetical protein